MSKSKSVFGLGVFLMWVAGAANAQLGPAPMPQIAKPTGPTLEETTKWITEKFQTTPPYVRSEAPWGDVEYRYKTLFDDCNVTVLEERKINNGKPEVALHHIHLRELDRDASEVSGRLSMFTIRTLGKREVVTTLKIDAFYTGGTGFEDSEAINFVSNKYLLSKEDPVKGQPYVFKGKQHVLNKYKIDFIWILFTTLEEAESMGNAFKHAAKLCQQKAAKERADQPAKKKDLF